MSVEDADEHAVAAARGFLAAPMGDALVLFKAGDLSPRSNLRSSFEDADNAAALPCYLDDGEALAGVIRETLGKHGIAADTDAFEYRWAHLGGDRRATRAELEEAGAVSWAGPGGWTRGCDGLGPAMARR